MVEVAELSEQLYPRYWVLCLLTAATETGMAPASRGNLFALGYLANAVADSLEGDAIQRSFLRRPAGPQMAVVAAELNRLVGLGLARVTRTVRALAGQLSPHYYSADAASKFLSAACASSVYLREVRRFHKQVAISFSELETGRIVTQSTADASFEEASVGIGDIVDIGELRLSYPTLEAVQLVQSALPSFRDQSAYAAVQVYGRFLATRSVENVAA